MTSCAGWLSWGVAKVRQGRSRRGRRRGCIGAMGSGDIRNVRGCEVGDLDVSVNVGGAVGWLVCATKEGVLCCLRGLRWGFSGLHNYLRRATKPRVL